MSVYVVSRDRLAHNIEELKRQAGGVPIWAVVKGDGYGLGLLKLAELLREHGIDRFCVTEASEAQRLRDNGFTEEKILMLRSLSDWETVSRLMDLKVILTVGSDSAVRTAEQAAAERADVAEVHLKIDTGMGRYGFAPEQIDEIVDVYRGCKHLAVSGIFTHFDCAFCNDERTRSEFRTFCGVLDALHSRGIETGTAHCCNSSAFLKFPDMHMDGVRLGSALLGRMAFPTRLRPVGFVQSQIDELHPVKKGGSTGYGAVWKAKRDSTVAIVPVGWYHGLMAGTKENRSRVRDCLRGVVSNLLALVRREQTTVEINGKTCPIVGLIGMLHCAVDVTDVDCACGDRVILQLNPLHLKGIPVQFR